MRWGSVLAVVSLVVTGAKADVKEVEARTRAVRDTMKELTRVLRSVTDKDTAKAGREQIDQLGRKLTERMDAGEKAAARLTPDEIAELKTKLEADKSYADAAADLEKQLERIEAIPEAAEALQVSPIFKLRRNAELERTFHDVNTLTRASQAFKIAFDRYPEKLDELMTPPDGKPFLPDKKSLLDPWSKPFQYDAKGPNNNGLKPDIWSEGPPLKAMVIGNWIKSVPGAAKK